jgi:hypothetical protein
MRIMIHFEPEEIISEVRFVSEGNTCLCFQIISFNLIPVDNSGRPVMTEEPLPEIFLQ